MKSPKKIVKPIKSDEKILPRTLRSQIVWLLLSSLVVAQSVSFFLIIGERSLISMDQRIDQSLNEFLPLLI